MPVHPALDVRVDFVPDEEDYDRTDRLPEPKSDCFERRIEFRIQQEEKLDRNRWSAVNGSTPMSDPLSYAGMVPRD